MTLGVTAPAAPGPYLLVLDLVQEDVAWFEAKGSPVFRAPVRVRGGIAARLRAWLGGGIAAGGTAVTNATDTALTLRAGVEAPVMRMAGVRREDVIATAESAGGRVVAVLEDPSSGREWRSFRYAVTRRDEPFAAYTPPMASGVPDDEWISARIEKAQHERAMALAAARRLEDEIRSLSYRIAELETDRVALKNRTEEAEAYVAAVKSSTPWRAIQWLRGLVGRKW